MAKCYSITPLYYATSSIGILFDLALLVTPMWIIHRQMIWSMQTLKVALIFAVGKSQIRKPKHSPNSINPT